MNYRLLLLAAVLMLAGCTKKPKELDFDSACCGVPNYVGDDDLIASIAILNTQGGSNFELNLLFIPTIFTPNRDLINETYGVNLYPSDNADFRAELTGYKIYNDRKKLLEELGPTQTWDGSGKNGTLDDGTFGYELTLKFPDGRELLVYGSFLLRSCIQPGDDQSRFIFADQLIAGSSATLTTNDPISSCN